MNNHQNRLENLQTSLEDPLFLQKIFWVITKVRKDYFARCGDNLKRVVAEEFDDLSKRLDRSGIQESCSVRNVMRTRRLAKLLVNDKGELNSSLLPKIDQSFKPASVLLGARTASRYSQTKSHPEST